MKMAAVPMTGKNRLARCGPIMSFIMLYAALTTISKNVRKVSLSSGMTAFLVSVIFFLASTANTMASTTTNKLAASASA